MLYRAGYVHQCACLASEAVIDQLDPLPMDGLASHSIEVSYLAR